MKTFKQVVEFACNAFAAVFLTILMILTFVDVVGRNFFDHPLIGANELTEYALAAVTFLSYPVVAYRHLHISVDLLDTFVGPKSKRIQQIVGDLLGAMLFGVLSYRFWVQGSRFLAYGDETPQLGIPIAPANFFISVMAAVTMLAFLLAAWEGQEIGEETLEARQGTM